MTVSGLLEAILRHVAALLELILGYAASSPSRPHPSDPHGQRHERQDEERHGQSNDMTYIDNISIPNNFILRALM